MVFQDLVTSLPAISSEISDGWGRDSLSQRQSLSETALIFQFQTNLWALWLEYQQRLKLLHIS